MPTYCTISHPDTPHFPVEPLTIMYEKRDACDQSRPRRDKEQRENKFGQDTAVHSKKDRPFRMLIEVSGTVLSTQQISTGSKQQEKGDQHIQSSCQSHRICDGGT